jgi:tetratricopeptide (TPR) repeat protein
LKEEETFDFMTGETAETEDISAIESFDPGTTLIQWRIGSLKEKKNYLETGPEAIEKWPDKESREAVRSLTRQGIDLPWGFGEEFGDRDFKITGLRAGGSGVVYFVELSSQDGKRPYAAKTLNSFLKSDYLELPPPVQEKISQTFLEEALPWLEMGQHPHIVSVHLLKNIVNPKYRRNVPFIFSEFVPGGRLKGFLRERGRLSRRESLTLGIQICDGLDHAYEHGLKAHLDIKPANIMVYRDGVFQVTDFSANVIGTPGYMSPEQLAVLWFLRGKKIIRDLPQVDQRADQFAVGLLILESCLGYNPYSAYRDAAWNRELADRYTREGIGESMDGSLNKALKHILLRSLALDPDNRYPEISSLREELASVYEREYGGYETLEVGVDDSAEGWFHRGEAFKGLGYFSSAEIPFQKALERYNRIPGSEFKRAVCKMGLGSIYRETGRFPEAKEMYENALDQFHQLSESELNQARCKMDLGNIHSLTGHYSEAKEAYQSALDIYHRIPGTELERARCVSNLGNVYGITGQSREAEKVIRKSLDIYRQIPGTEFRRAIGLMNLGNVYFTNFRYLEAERMYKEALENYRRIPGTELNQAKGLINIGSVYSDTGRYAEAGEIMDEALQILQRISGTELDQATCYISKGVTYIESSRYQEARAAVGKALKMFRKMSGTELDQAWCVENMGILYRNTGNYGKAERYFQKAMRIYRSFPGTELEQGRCASDFASCIWLMKDFSRARRLAEKALELCKPLQLEVTQKIRNNCRKILDNTADGK